MAGLSYLRRLFLKAKSRILKKRKEAQNLSDDLIHLIGHSIIVRSLSFINHDMSLV